MGAGLSLIVTIIGGFVVAILPNFDTKKAENLTYLLTSHGAFTGGTQNVAIASLVVANDGNIAAKSVSVSAVFKDAKILDVAFLDVRALRNFQQVRTEYEFSASFDGLLPSESLTINLLLSKPESPDVVLRSDTTKGKPKFVSVDPEESKQKKKKDLLSSLLAAAGLVGLLVALFTMRLSKRERERRRERSIKEQRFVPSQNNVAFLLLHHHANHKLASRILERAFFQGRYDSLVLSNYAVCKALDSNFDESIGLIDAAKFLKPVDHVLATVMFNEGVIGLIRGYDSLATNHFSAALAIAPEATATYLQTSYLLADYRKNDAYRQLKLKFPKPASSRVSITTGGNGTVASNEA